MAAGSLGNAVITPLQVGPTGVSRARTHRVPSVSLLRVGAEPSPLFDNRG